MAEQPIASLGAATAAPTLTGKIPATIVTGFLGAGKTSLIRHLLATANGKRLALVINEFGELGVDGEVLKACGSPDCDEGDIIELANGCLCCTVADDFLPTIEKLLARPQRPDHIIVETSGLALPKPLVAAFGWPEVRTRVTVDGVIAVIDGPAVADGQFAADPAAVDAQRENDASLDHDSPLAELLGDQLACADLVIINKADLMEPASLASVEASLGQTLRPAVKVATARHGAIDATVLLGLAAGAEDDLAARPSHHDQEEDHDHDEFESFVVEIEPLATVAGLTERLRQVIAAHGILRLKGFLPVAGKEMRLVVQAVGDRVQHYFDRDWTTEEERSGRLVVIGFAGLDRTAIAAALQA